jgi:hypothetical protein
MRVILNVAGVLAMLFGCIWVLQGMNVLLGSPMSGQTRWTAYGCLAVVVGVGLLVAANRRRT